MNQMVFVFILLLIVIALDVLALYGLRRHSRESEEQMHALEWSLRRELHAERAKSEQLLRETRQQKESNNEFFMLMSHELRTPLHALSNYLAFLREDLQSGNVETALRQHSAVEKHGWKLQRLVEQIELLAQIESSRDNWQMAPLSLSLLVANEAVASRSVADERGIGFEWVHDGKELWVRGNEALLVLMLRNLMENAIAACRAGQKIGVALNEQPGATVLTVRDTGVGLSPDEIAKLFQPFGKTASSIAASRDGSGLGLYLCRLIAELHGGTIQAASRGHGSGTAFTVELPRFLPETPEGQE